MFRWGQDYFTIPYALRAKERFIQNKYYVAFSVLQKGHSEF